MTRPDVVPGTILYSVKQCHERTCHVSGLTRVSSSLESMYLFKSLVGCNLV